MAELYAKNAGQWVEVRGGNEGMSMKVKICTTYDEFYNFFMSLKTGTMIPIATVPNSSGFARPLTGPAIVMKENSSDRTVIIRAGTASKNFRVTPSSTYLAAGCVADENKAYSLNQNIFNMNVSIDFKGATIDYIE